MRASYTGQFKGPAQPFPSSLPPPPPVTRTGQPAKYPGFVFSWQQRRAGKEHPTEPRAFLLEISCNKFTRSSGEIPPPCGCTSRAILTAILCALRACAAHCRSVPGRGGPRQKTRCICNAVSHITRHIIVSASVIRPTPPLPRPLPQAHLLLLCPLHRLSVSLDSCIATEPKRLQ